ncbi:putative reverse transcriptase domain-containing protein [Tanacetum coccineum]|uniref:Reverse transcriptase domain-containing protein n=1 Tax=Tanacetum coccineum TaxID=301880 RepID=A0ABQ5FM01_9ASTR
MAPMTRRGQNTPTDNTNPNNMTLESVQAMIDQALQRNSTNEDASHSSHGDNRRNVQTVRPCFYADFMKCQPLNFKWTEGMVKFATCTLLGAALTWWNGQIRTLGPEAYAMTWEVLKKKMTDKYCPRGEIKKLEIKLWNLKVKGNDVPAYTKCFQELTLICTKFVANETEKVDKYISGLPDNIYGNVKSARPKTLDETIELANDLMDQKLRTYAERQSDNKRKADDSSRNNHGHQQQPFKRQNVAKVYNMGTGERKPYGGSLPKCTKCHLHHNGPCTQKCHKCNKVGHFARDCRSTGNTNVANTQKGNGAAPKGNGCFECGAPGHFKRDCPKLKNKDGGNGNAQGWAYVVGNAEKRGNASRNPDANVVTDQRRCFRNVPETCFGDVVLKGQFKKDCQNEEHQQPAMNSGQTVYHFAQKSESVETYLTQVGGRTLSQAFSGSTKLPHVIHGWGLPKLRMGRSKDSAMKKDGFFSGIRWKFDYRVLTNLTVLYHATTPIGVADRSVWVSMGAYGLDDSVEVHTVKLIHSPNQCTCEVIRVETLRSRRSGSVVGNRRGSESGEITVGGTNAKNFVMIKCVLVAILYHARMKLIGSRGILRSLADDQTSWRIRLYNDDGGEHRTEQSMYWKPTMRYQGESNTVRDVSAGGGGYL